MLNLRLIDFLIASLCHRIQRSKTDCCHNNFENVGSGIAQNWMLGNVYPNLGVHDLFLLDFKNIVYTDDVFLMIHFLLHSGQSKLASILTPR